MQSWANNFISLEQVLIPTHTIKFLDRLNQILQPPTYKELRRHVHNEANVNASVCFANASADSWVNLLCILIISWFYGSHSCVTTEGNVFSSQ